MKLFEEMEKCFPEMEKHFRSVYVPDALLGFWMQAYNRDEFFFWTRTHFLVGENTLVDLFRQTGIRSRETMTAELVRWFLYDLCSKDEIIRADIAPVLESMYRSSHPAL